MKKNYFIVAVACALVGSMTFTSCIGSFTLTNKVLAWNKQVSNKFVNELAFIVMHIIPVYPVSIFIDTIVLNSIEFWSGSNPLSASTQTIETENGRFLVACDGKGYNVTNETTGESVRFSFNEQEQSWAVEKDGESVTFMSFVDDSHVKMLTPNGDFQTVEVSAQGVYAYNDMVLGAQYAFNK